MTNSRKKHKRKRPKVTNRVITENEEENNWGTLDKGI